MIKKGSDSENNNKSTIQDSVNQYTNHRCFNLLSFVAVNLAPDFEAQKQVWSPANKIPFQPYHSRCPCTVRMPMRLVRPSPEKLIFQTKGSRTPRKNTRSFLLFSSKTDNDQTKPLTSLRDGSRPICAMAIRV